MILAYKRISNPDLKGRTEKHSLSSNLLCQRALCYKIVLQQISWKSGHICLVILDVNHDHVTCDPRDCLGEKDQYKRLLLVGVVHHSSFVISIKTTKW